MRRILRTVVLACLAALVVAGVPDSDVRPAHSALVTVRGADAVDVRPHVVWILAVGSDARPGQPILRSRGDAIQLVGINTVTGHAVAIGIPRDSWVAVPGHGMNRVNSGLYFGGPQLMARTVQGLTGIAPHYVFVTDFDGMARMASAIGGITVNSRYAFTDQFLKPAYTQGPNRINGMAVTNFARIRKSLPRGDFDRSANQQEVLRAIWLEIRRNSWKQGFVERGVTAAMRDLHTDVAPGQLFRLAHAIAQVQHVRGCVIGGRTGNVGAASVVFPDVAQARRLGRDARPDAWFERC